MTVVVVFVGGEFLTCNPGEIGEEDIHDVISSVSKGTAIRHLCVTLSGAQVAPGCTGRTVTIAFHIGVFEVCREGVAGLPQQCEAATKLFKRALILLEEGVVNVTICFPATQRNTRGKSLATTLNKAFSNAATIFLDGDVDLTRGALTDNGRGTGDVDGARYGVLTEQRTLRSAEHLDTFDIQQRRAILSAAAEINAIKVHTHRLLKAAVITRADTAHIDVGIHRRIGNVQAGYEISQRGKVQDGIVLDLLAAHRTDGNRYVLQAFSALLRRHNDFFQLRLCRQTDGQAGRSHELIQLIA